MSNQVVPVIHIYDMLLVTVPTDPDDDTVSSMQERVLKEMEKTEAKGLILDISTVQTLDSFFARVIVETSQMFRLMGGKTIIAGMQPSVAITATQLGLDLGEIRTTLDVDAALDILRLESDGGRF